MVQNKSLSEYTDDAPAPPPAPPCLLSYTDAPPPPPPPPPAAPPLLLAPAPTLDGSLESGGPPVVYPNADMSLVMMLMATLTTPVDVTRVTATVKPGQKGKVRTGTDTLARQELPSLLLTFTAIALGHKLAQEELLGVQGDTSVRGGGRAG